MVPPAITQVKILAKGILELEWNESAKGMKLQRASNLNNAVWADVSGSENTNHVSLAISSGNEFFRLMKP